MLIKYYNAYLPTYVTWVIGSLSFASSPSSSSSSEPDPLWLLLWTLPSSWSSLFFGYAWVRGTVQKEMKNC